MYILYSLLLFIIFFILIITSLYITFNKELCYETANIERFNNETVDAVYTWVNTNDTDWLKVKNKYSNKNIKYDNRPKRWTNTITPYDEILLSIKSVRKNLPWIKNIYVVAQRPQTLPKWILNRYNVIMVYHDEIFPNGSRLPTFNSVAIETNLYRIPGLSEKFIYFNDDMYIAKPLKYENFFINNKPILRILNIYSFYVSMFPEIYINEQHNEQEYNNKKILNKKSKKHGNILVLNHQATPITKTIMENTEKSFPNEWNKTRNTRFRTGKVIIPIYLALNLAYRNKDAILLKNDKVKSIIAFNEPNLINETHDLVCINEISKNSINMLKKKLKIS